MPKTRKIDIDFAALSVLAESDPEAFEARRADIIETYIRLAPPERQHRLRCLQWRIDQVRRTSRTPLAACIKISQMMWDSAMGPGGLRETLNRVAGTMSSVEPVYTPARPSAKVLEFRPPRGSDPRLN